MILDPDWIVRIFENKAMEGLWDGQILLVIYGNPSPPALEVATKSWNGRFTF